MERLRLAAVLCLTAASACAGAADAVTVDVAVYGGTSGGVVAAVQAARMGKSVVLVEPGRHLGGMTSGGLSAVDIGDPRTIGGIAREFFTRLVARYGKKLSWDEPHKAVGGSGGGTGGAYAIEPHVAEEVFGELVKEAGVTVLRDARLIEVAKDGPRIRQIVVTGPHGAGRTIAARMFIDTTYEGDLMAAAGVSHTLNREGRDKYDESLAGIRYADWCRPRALHEQPGPNGRKPGGQGVWDRDFPLDPYVRKGDPSSGLLPLINPGEPGTPGEAAPGVQAYCFRLCLTTAADRLPIEPPPGYDPARYEILVRFIEACLANGDDMDLRWFSKHDPVPNEKYDFNTATFGGNLPGASWGWCEANHERRQELFREHEHHQRGLLHFLATDPRVPAKVRADMRRFGLPRDEFRDTGGWPHQLYVREGRRMIGDLVMTQHHVCGKREAADPVSLGSYGIDAHEIRRIAKDGVVTREGKLAEGREGAGPYGVSYRSIVPKRAECDNLFVTFAVSASHVAFSSIRMEPVFMASSQSAATAAAMAIDAGVPVQAVDYAKLAARLVADGQILRVPAPPPDAPKNAAKPEDVNGKSYDLVVIGGTPGGIACAVRAAREGLTTLLVQHNGHLGGMLTNGLMQWDALSGGPRSPIFDEYAQLIEDHYRETYGDHSPQVAAARYTQTHYPMSRFEPSVAERLFNRLVSAESNITTLLSHYPAAVTRDGLLLKTLTLRGYGTTNDITVHGDTFVDATYEGDLAGVAKVPFRVGRESRAEFGEPHAGKVFTNIVSKQGPKDALEGRLNLHPYAHAQGSIDPTSPHTADEAIQAYNHRFCVSNEAGRIRLPERPPGYDREAYVHYNRKGLAAGAINGKSSWNSAILPGENHAYPQATWPEREKIIARHTSFALGLMYFLQNDESVPAATRDNFRRIGLPLDEFPDNDNLPYEIYVREARRIVGRKVFTEHDNVAAAGQTRPPIQADSIGFTDWCMDSHDCTTDRRPGYEFDGKLILTEESRPAQVPYRCLLPREIDNLLVPVCLSATHVAWGAVRLEPVWMQTGEAAGYAAAIAKQRRTTPGALDADLLIRALVNRGHLVTFFNEGPLGPAAQYFGTKGFFTGYDARLDEPLTEAVQAAWQEGFGQLERGTLDAAQLAAAVRAAESRQSPTTEERRGDALQRLWERL